jgi:ankyrin repeat protein
VFCQLDTLRRCMPSSIRKALDELPTTLDGTYERTLQEIPKEKRQHAHRLFQCLVVAIRPLCVEELAELFAIEFDPDAGPNLKEGWRPENPEDAVLSACSSLIAVIEDSGLKIVQFSHFSVKEFLTSDRLRTSEIGNIRHYHTPLDAAHTIFARACLSVLLQLDENVDEKRLEAFPLAFYSAEHWVDHAQYEDVASQVQDLTEQLFDPGKPYLAAWTWIHDMDHPIWLQKTVEKHPTRSNATALYYAVLCGFSGLASYLIISHAENVNAKCGYHGTPLHAASYEGHFNAARLLLTHGVDINALNTRYKTPLCSAYDGRQLDMMRLLLEHGANVDPYYVDTYYNSLGLLSHNASYCGRADALHLLLQHNADVNARNDYEETPLHHASDQGQAGAAQLLLEHGAIVDVQNRFHNTPLYEASRGGRLEIVQILLRHGADVHIRGGIGRTPFQAATLRGYNEIAQLLLEHGAEKE